MKLLSILSLFCAFPSKSTDFSSVKSVQQKPIILLDVDGVINMVGDGKMWPDLESKRNIESCNGHYTIDYSPSMVKSINAWNKLAEIRWLTTWNEFALTSLTPALGFDQFKLGRTEAQNEEKATSATRIAKEVGDDTLIIWLDDDTNMGEFYERPNTLLLKPKWGLRPEHVKLVDDCLVKSDLWKGKVIKEFERWKRG